MSIINIRKNITDIEWDNFVDNSEDGTIFHKIQYLKTIDWISYTNFFIEYKKNLVAGCILIHPHNDLSKVLSHQQAIYSGVIFNQREKTRAPKVMQENHNVLIEICNYLDQNFSEIDFSLSTTINDIRAFQWHNYGKEGRKFNIDILYTSKITLDDSLSSLDSTKKLFKSLEPVRRYSIRQAIKNKANIEFNPNISQSIDFYKEMMINYWDEDYSLDLHVESIKNSLNKLRECNLLRSCATQNSDGNMTYIVFYLFDSKRAYYLYGIKTPFTNSYDGTYVNWTMWKTLLEQDSIKEVDLEGVNSPQRGWFKLSFGGTLENYYRIKLS